jgi:hypothetical protein
LTRTLARSFNTTKEEHEEIERYVVNNVLGQKAMENWLTTHLRKHFCPIVSKDKTKKRKNYEVKYNNKNHNSNKHKKKHDGEEMDDDIENDEDVDRSSYSRDEQELIELIDAANANIQSNGSHNKCYEWVLEQNGLLTAQIKIGMTQFAQYDNSRKSKTSWSTVEHNNRKMDSNTKLLKKRQMKKSKSISVSNDISVSDDVMNNMASVIQLKNATYWEVLKQDYIKFRDTSLLGSRKHVYFNGMINDTIIATSTRLLNYTNDESDIYLCSIQLVQTVVDQRPYNYPATTSLLSFSIRPLTKKIILFPLHGHSHFSLLCFWRLDLLLEDSSNESCILWLDSCNNYHQRNNRDWSNIKK